MFKKTRFSSFPINVEIVTSSSIVVWNKMNFRHIFITFSIFSLVDCTSYKTLRIKNCTSFEENVMKIEGCALISSKINMTFDIKRPLNKFSVGFLGNIFTVLQFDYSNSTFNQVDVAFSASKIQTSANSSTFHVLNGVIWCQGQKSQID